MKTAPDMSDRLFPVVLRLLRKAKKMTQEGLASLVDCDRSTVSCWERGMFSPSVMPISKLAIALDVSPVDIVAWCATDYIKRDIIGHSTKKDDWRLAMAYEIVQKQARVSSIGETVSVSSNGRLFYLSAELLKNRFTDCDYVQIFLDKDASSSTVRVAFRPMKRSEKNTYKLVRPAKGYTAFIAAKLPLTEIGYHNTEKYSCDAEWHERMIEGRKLGVVEFEIEKKFTNLK